MMSRPVDITNLHFKQVELWGIVSRILWKLVFAVGESYVIDVDARKQLKKMLKDFDNCRREYGQMVNEYAREGGEE